MAILDGDEGYLNMLYPKLNETYERKRAKLYSFFVGCTERKRIIKNYNCYYITAGRA